MKVKRITRAIRIEVGAYKKIEDYCNKRRIPLSYGVGELVDKVFGRNDEFIINESDKKFYKSVGGKRNGNKMS